MGQILTHKPKGRRFNYNTAVLYSAKARGTSSLRIGLEAILLSLGRTKLTGEDYFLNGAWRPGLSWSERRSFVGKGANLGLNLALNPPLTPTTERLTKDKLAGDFHFRKAGLPVVPTKAVASASDLGHEHRRLATPEEVLDFLREPGAVPCFGKPVHGSTGLGAVWIQSWQGNDDLLLGDGRQVVARSLVAEIWAEHPDGFIFADIAHPHPQLARLIGPVIGTLRLVTVDEGTGPDVLYAVLKTPGPGATVDSLAGPIGGYAAVDVTTGAIFREQDRRQLGGIDLEKNAVTGAALSGQVLPDFQQALLLARAAHACLGDHGILGIDILLTDKGPVVNEANRNPHHSAYQIAAARGVLNKDYLPRLKAVRERFRSAVPRPKFCPLK